MGRGVRLDEALGRVPVGTWVSGDPVSERGHDPDMSEYAREFGKHIRSLRRARGITQEQLAVRSSLSPDTIRRVEHGSFSASIETLRKLCRGLGLSPSTLFESFELDHIDGRRELLDLLALATSSEIASIVRVIRVLLDELDGARR